MLFQIKAFWKDPLLLSFCMLFLRPLYTTEHQKAAGNAHLSQRDCALSCETTHQLFLHLQVWSQNATCSGLHCRAGSLQGPGFIWQVEVA